MSGYEIDASKALNAIKELNGIIEKGNAKAALIVARKARDIARPRFREAHKSKARGGTMGTIKALAVRKGKYKGAILKGNYIVRFLDLGTKDRKTKGGWNRGSITADHILTDAANDAAKDYIDQVREGIKI